MSTQVKPPTGQRPVYSSDGSFLGSVSNADLVDCMHPHAKDIGSCAEGCCDKYACPDCGRRFLVEVPD